MSLDCRYLSWAFKPEERRWWAGRGGVDIPMELTWHQVVMDLTCKTLISTHLWLLFGKALFYVLWVLHQFLKENSQPCPFLSSRKCVCTFSLSRKRDMFKQGYKQLWRESPRSGLRERQSSVGGRGFCWWTIREILNQPLEAAGTVAPLLPRGAFTWTPCCERWAASLPEKPGVSFSLGQSPSLMSQNELGVVVHKWGAAWDFIISHSRR